jgi:uncharacterized protein YaaQ
MFFKKIFIIFCLLSCFVQSSCKGNDTSQQTKGDCSSAIITQGNVTVECGVPQKAIDRLLKNLNEKNITQQEYTKKINNWIQKYKKLERL